MIIEWPDVTIMVCTYNRYTEIRKTVSKLIQYIDYPQDKVHLMIADDRSGDDYLQRLANLKDFQHWNTAFVETDSNCGWGCNINNALSQVWTEYVFFLEDDYVLTQPLDLKLGIGLMECAPFLGMLRYRATAGGHFIMHHLEVDARKWLPDYVQGNAGLVPGRITYCLLDNRSPELYIYSHGPHLKRKNFHSSEFYGPYPEKLKLGETEETFAKIVKEKMQAEPHRMPAIGILPEWITMAWEHIGKSYQGSKWDK